MKEGGRASEKRSRVLDSRDRIWTDIKLKLIPRSSRNEILGKKGDFFRVKVTSPPIEGRANQALIELLSKSFNVPKRDIDIISGERSRIKQIRVHGLSFEDITSLLDK